MIRWSSVIFLLASQSWAAVPGGNKGSDVQKILRKPHLMAVAELQKGDTSNLRELEKLSFDSKESMETRWRAFMVLTAILGKKAIPVVKKALVSPTWYMRSAGLEAMHKLDPQASKRWALQKLNSDRALLVRMKGVEILQHSMDEKVTELFWKKMFSKDSFHQKQGLWIRKGLAQALVKKPRQKDLALWVKLLHESESSIQYMAGAALNQLGSRSTGDSIRDISSLKRQYPLTESL